MRMIKFIGVIQIPISRNVGFGFLRLLQAAGDKYEEEVNYCEYVRGWYQEDGSLSFYSKEKTGSIRGLFFQGTAVRNFTNRMRIAKLIDKCKAEGLRFCFVICDNESGWEYFGDASLIKCTVTFDNGWNKLIEEAV